MLYYHNGPPGVSSGLFAFTPWIVERLPFLNPGRQHRVRSFDETLPRDMRRTTIAGTSPTVAQVLAA